MFQIKWFDKAIIEQKKIVEYWIENNQSDTYARKIYNEVQKIEKFLMSAPYIGSPTKYNNVRKYVFLKNFSLFYKVDKSNQTCYIIYFWDNRQNPKKLNSIIKN